MSDQTERERLKSEVLAALHHLVPGVDFRIYRIGDTFTISFSAEVGVTIDPSDPDHDGTIAKLVDAIASLRYRCCPDFADLEFRLETARERANELTAQVAVLQDTIAKLKDRGYR